MAKIVLIGTGAVGASFAYACVLKSLCNELVLIDVNQQKALGDAIDLNHAMACEKPMQITAGAYSDCAGADIIVITAGTAQRPGETRLDLMHRNVAIFKAILAEVERYAPPEAILLIASNPVDILTHVAYKLSGRPKAQVIGSGTVLDSNRFRFLVGEALDVSPRSVHGFVIGEHGDSEVPVWSSLQLAGIQVGSEGRYGISDAEKERIFRETVGAAGEIIRLKGATYYGIASALARICEAILRDHRAVLPVSSFLEGYYGISDVCLGVPSLLGRDGVIETLEIPLTEEERAKLVHSAETLKTFIKEIGY
ncbi:MAG TPA: L-lactate dehydrogenase [Symbiobacteriaceae bacterium]|nr:L-lactate dehydrogenase [Symbiobacteriaceae bacterium]